MKKDSLIAAIALMAFLLLLVSSPASAQGITTYIKGEGGAPPEPQRTYEISASSRDIGHSMSLQQSDELRLPVFDAVYLLYVTEVGNGAIVLTKMPENKDLIMNPEQMTINISLNETRLIKFLDTAKEKEELVQFRLESAADGVAGLYIKTYNGKDSISANYSELFDIDVRLPNTRLARASELVASVSFINFGQGASQIALTYLITDTKGREYYHGSDNRVVYAQDSLIKRFDGLTLPVGDYLLESRIDYGKNQTAKSTADFSIVPSEGISQYLAPGIFICLAVSLFLVLSAKKYLYDRYEKE